MLQSDSKFAPKDHSAAGTDDKVAVAALCIGVALWAVSALGLDPTNVPQRQDFEQFHLPSVRVFAERPFVEAVADYPAAPFPLFYILAGWLYRATGSVLALQAATVALALGLLACIAVIARARFGGSRPHTLLLLATVLISPYFRGQSVYANTDILALLFAFAAIAAFGEDVPRFPRARVVAALGLACCAVYTRQVYLFLPAYFFIRIWAVSSWRDRAALAACSAILAAPVLALVAFWGGVTPPRFSEHAAGPSVGDSIPAVILLLSFYAMPLAVATVSRHRDALLTALRSPTLQAMIAPFIFLAGYLLLRGGDIPDVVGGGMPLHMLRGLPVPEPARGALLAGAVAVGGAYLAYLVHQDPLRNGIVVLVALCFFPTGILYQRYFDPLMPLVYAAVLSTREMSARSGRMVLLLMVALELVVAAVGAVHYRAVFWGGGA
jgi:hypothetical protein